MSYYRDSFPRATVTPKLHMLENHVIPFLSKWKVGFGFMGEQGAESIHARFNDIGKHYGNMRSPAQRLESILDMHLTQVCPHLIVIKPEPKKRKTMPCEDQEEDQQSQMQIDPPSQTR